MSEKDELFETMVSSEEIFHGRLLHIFRDVVRLPNGNQVTRELFRHWGAVCIVPLTDDGKIKLESGIVLNDGTCYKPALISFCGENDRRDVLIRITEGKFHEVKRMFQSVGCEVTDLERLAIGELELDKSLSPGESRFMTDKELAAIFTDHK